MDSFLCLSATSAPPFAVDPRLESAAGLMAQAVETVSRRCMTRECLFNAAVATGLLAGGALVVIAAHSFYLWFFANYFWMW